jgi:hypothetical protein
MDRTFAKLVRVRLEMPHATAEHELSPSEARFRHAAVRVGHECESRNAVSSLALVVVACFGCGEVEAPLSLYASEVVRFEVGAGAGFGQQSFPAVVLGPPGSSGTTSAASLDVLSLGAQGTIELGFAGAIVDGPGPDFVVFENPFFVQGDPNDPYAELGEVEVSEDGVVWRKFTCNREGEGRWPGCAGWTPTSLIDPAQPLDPEACGGDAFDLAEVGLARARYVRVVDLDGGGEMLSVGFDLDAVGVVHFSVCGESPHDCEPD